MAPRGFLSGFLRYLGDHKRLWLAPLAVLALLLLLVAALLFGPGTLNVLYQVF